MRIDVLELLDITAPPLVEIEIKGDGKTVWVNVDGVCRLRACRIERLVLSDQRSPLPDIPTDPDEASEFLAALKAGAYK